MTLADYERRIESPGYDRILSVVGGAANLLGDRNRAISPTLT